MNSIHKINAINQKELELDVTDDASWHADYKDTAYIYIGNLHHDLKEEDILKIFSQYGNPSHINLVKDKDTGKPRGFCYLKYEDQRSCALAVDNFNGSKIYERPLRVDHTYYRLIEGQNEDDFKVEYPEIKAEKSKKKKIQLLDYIPDNDKLKSPAEQQLSIEADNTAVSNISKAVDDDDFEDPMAGVLQQSEPDRKRRKTHHKHKHHSRSSKSSDKKREKH